MSRDFASPCLNPILYLHRRGTLQITTMKTTQTRFIQYLDNPLIDGRKRGAFPRDGVVGTELNKLNSSTDLNSLEMATFTGQEKIRITSYRQLFKVYQLSFISVRHISQLGNHIKVTISPVTISPKYLQ